MARPQQLCLVLCVAALGCAGLHEDLRRAQFAYEGAAFEDALVWLESVEDEIAHARRVIAAFSSGAGAVSLDGKMLDIPHLKSARQMLHSAGLEQE